MDVQLPDGTLVRDVPDGTSKADLVAKLKANGHDVSGLETPTQLPYLDRVKAQITGSLGAVPDAAQNLTLGALRGAGSIGATIMAPLDAGARALGVDPNSTLASFVGRTDRRQGLTDATQTLGADPNSLAYKTGKFGAEVAGTAGAGGVLANGLRAGAGAAGLGYEAVPLANALASNGFRTGVVDQGLAANLLTRSAGGALAGGAQVGLADPEHAGTGALIGAALPPVAKAVGDLGAGAGDLARAKANSLMQSALKPTLAQKQSGDAAKAAQTLLDYGINPTPAGVEKIKGMIGDLNDQIASAIKNSDQTIDKAKVLNALARSRATFGNQVAPTEDLAAIDKIGADFAGTHPDELPVQLAQQRKQGTYGILKGKYGEQGSAATEAQKDLARGLKEGIAEAVPEVGPLNAAESRLLSTLKVTERRAMMDANKNPVALDAGLALATGHPGSAVGLLANSSAWGKAMAARGLNGLAGGTPDGVNALLGPAAYRAIPSTARR